MSTAPMWPDEDMKVLTEKWAEGLSAGQISRVFSGKYTRNAVIGKVHRMKLPPRAVRVRTARPSRARVRPKRASRRVAVKQFKAPLPTPITVRRIPTNPAKPTIWKSLMELEPHDCRWIYGDPQEDGVEYRYCGLKDDGSSYCPEHHAQSVQEARQ